PGCGVNEVNARGVDQTWVLSIGPLADPDDDLIQIYVGRDGKVDTQRFPIGRAGAVDQLGREAFSIADEVDEQREQRVFRLLHPCRYADGATGGASREGDGLLQCGG